MTGTLPGIYTLMNLHRGGPVERLITCAQHKNNYLHVKKIFIIKKTNKKQPSWFETKNVMTMLNQDFLFCIFCVKSCPVEVNIPTLTSYLVNL